MGHEDRSWPNGQLTVGKGIRASRGGPIDDRYGRRCQSGELSHATVWVMACGLVASALAISMSAASFRPEPANVIAVPSGEKEGAG